MSSLYITEYSRLAIDRTGATVVVGQEPSKARYPVAITAASLQSPVFKADTKFVRLHSEAKCHVVFDVDPIATTDDTPLAANQTEFFGVISGLRLAVTQGV